MDTVHDALILVMIYFVAGSENTLFRFLGNPKLIVSCPVLILYEYENDYTRYAKVIFGKKHTILFWHVSLDFRIEKNQMNFFYYSYYSSIIIYCKFRKLSDG